MGARSLHARVITAARRHGDHLAVVDETGSLTYDRLLDEAGRLAAWLTAAGVQPGDRVAIALEKSCDTVTALLGVLLAGAAYVPIDPKSPADRVAWVLDDCKVKAIITTPQRFGTLAALPGRQPERVVLHGADGEAGAGATAWSDILRATPPLPVAVEPAAEDLAYILYTSGSTGRPKGVMISHRAALAFVDWAVVHFSLCAEDRLSSHAPFHFDLSIFDLFAGLAAGASVWLVPQKVMPFPRSLALWLEQSAITVWYSVPSALVRLSLYGVLERSNLSTLRRVLFAGEVFPIRHLRGLMQSIPHASFHNLYGPTETNVCTMFDVPAVLPADWLSLPIGRACSGDQVLALDDSGRPAGPGAIGELCVQGPSLMSGYWGDADRTARVLVRDLAAFDAAAQVYRTGDYVTRDGDGNWCFVGRRDLQVKSRGYRIELGEVESVLHLHPAVEEAVVLPEPHDEFGCTLRALVVLAAGRQAIASELLGFCATRLPDYMLPAKIEVVDRFPRTSSGKTDRVALAG